MSRDRGGRGEGPHAGAGTPSVARTGRRKFSAEYKLRVLAEYDAASASGAKKAILDREGLYTANIVEWRRARRAGALAELAKSRGRPRQDPRDVALDRLRREKERLETELAKARLVIDVQGKVHALLENVSGSAPARSTDPSSPPRSTGSATLLF